MGVREASPEPGRRASLESSQKELLSLLLTRSFKRGRVVLTSGKESDYYIDVKQTIFTPKGLTLMGELLFAEVKKVGAESVGGMAVGAIPLVSAVLAHSAREGYQLEGFFVRPTAKDHGLRRQVEGCFSAGSRIAILEDVMTTGGSSYEAIRQAEEAGGKIVQVITLVDREEGGREFLAEKGYALTAVFPIQNLLRASVR